MSICHWPYLYDNSSKFVFDTDPIFKYDNSHSIPIRHWSYIFDRSQANIRIILDTLYYDNTHRNSQVNQYDIHTSYFCDTTQVAVAQLVK